MTLVAALKIEGVPSLIGDFLLTDEQQGVDHFYLPTRPTLNDPSHLPLPRRVSGLARKLHLVNQRFIVGFTGSRGRRGSAPAGGFDARQCERPAARARSQA
jgi:hypothetical protein